MAAPAKAKAAAPTQQHQDNKRIMEAKRKYGRGRPVNTYHVRDKKLRSNLQAVEEKYKAASLRAKDAEILHEHEAGFLEPQGEMERTYRVRQDEIAANVGVETAKKKFELRLEDFGPYRMDYTRNGRELLLAGRKGHVATMDWRNGKLGCELHLRETVRDARWLHNNQYFAVAQKKSVYIYDSKGVELHCLDRIVEPCFLEFLPYHFLLASAQMSGHLKYTDTSTGQLVAEIPTKVGAPTALAQNPWNAIMHVGHQNGTVTLWSPNTEAPLVKALVHRGPVRSIAIDRQGRYMVSTGQDLRMQVWDIRMYREVHSYSCYQPGSSVSISDRGLTAVGWGTQVSVWRGLFDAAASDQGKVQSPYMACGGDGQRIENMRWCPFEDVLGVAHDKGFASIIVPGAGEPNFDALEVNPYENPKQRQEAEVRGLLHKLQPGMISLDPTFIGRVDTVSDKKNREEKDLDHTPEDTIEKLKNRGRGRNSALRKYLRKKGRRNVIDEKLLKAQTLHKERAARAKERLKAEREELGPALARFAKKDV
ncbi:WDR46/Utp7 family WD40 repeat domain-containing protein [Aspergillus lucknowensis]|uniref:WD40-repeat-containing domain protein n=1 Tax=Aspergillus lucknowensis TaxID=176173 RepID=A0ABR4M838_9EURO